MISKTLIGAASALSLGLAFSTTTVQPASAGDAGAFIAGAIGGTALGAIAGGALAGPRYAPAPVYVAPVEAACFMERRPVLDPAGYVVGYRRVRVCE